MQANVKQASNRFIIFFIVLFYVLCFLIRIEGPIYSIGPSKKIQSYAFCSRPRYCDGVQPNISRK